MRTIEEMKQKVKSAQEDADTWVNANWGRVQEFAKKMMIAVLAAAAIFASLFLTQQLFEKKKLQRA